MSSFSLFVAFELSEGGVNCRTARKKQCLVILLYAWENILLYGMRGGGGNILLLLGEGGGNILLCGMGVGEENILIYGMVGRGGGGGGGKHSLDSQTVNVQWTTAGLETRQLVKSPGRRKNTQQAPKLSNKAMEPSKGALESRKV